MNESIDKTQDVGIGGKDIGIVGKEVGIGRIIVVFLLSAISTLLILKINHIMPSFIETFSGFNTKLSFSTRLVLSLYPIYLGLAFVFMLPAAMVLIKKVGLSLRNKMLPLSVGILIVTINYFGFAIWALYYPAF
jgi:hypothetical protein